MGFIQSDDNNDYIVYVENNILKIKNIETENEITIADWDAKYELTNYSMYLEEENQICIALREKGKLDDYGNELVGIEYYYNLNTKEITSKEKNGSFTYLIGGI